MKVNKNGVIVMSKWLKEQLDPKWELADPVELNI
jgi:hypothetical protein